MMEMLIPGCAAPHPTVWCRWESLGHQGQPAAGAPPTAQRCLCEAMPGSGEPQPGKVLPWLCDTHTEHNVGENSAQLSPLHASPHTLHPQHRCFGEARGPGRRSWSQGDPAHTGELSPQEAGSAHQGYVPLHIQIKTQTRLPKAGQHLDLLPLVSLSLRWQRVFTQRCPAMPQWWIKGRPPPQQVPGSHVHCGQGNQRRGKGQGLRAGREAKGRTAPRTCSEFINFPVNLPHVATKALPMGDKQPCLSFQGWQISRKIHTDACEPFSCSSHQQGQLRPKQPWLLVAAMRTQNGKNLTRME